MNPATALNAKLRFGSKLTLYALLALVLLYTATGLLAANINWTTLLVPCATLLVFLPGILSQRPRSYDWLCFVILLHFTVGVTNAMSPQSAWQDYLQILLSVLLFVSAMMTSRWLKAEFAARSMPAHSNDT